MREIDSSRDACRDVRGVTLWDHAWQDIRVAVRALRKRPAFALTVMLTLAVGIGATTAVFSVMYGVLLRPLPYKDPDRLLVVRASQQPVAPGLRPQTLFSGAELADWAARAKAFASVAGSSQAAVAITTPAGLETVPASYVSDEFFATLGEPFALGRPPSARSGPEAAISSRIWRSRFASDPDLVGHAVTLNGDSFVVAGVVADGFQWPARDTDVWVPLAFYNLTDARGARRPNPLGDRKTRQFLMVSRLRPGTSIAQAQDEVARVARSLAADFPATNKGFSAAVVPLRTIVTSDVRLPVLVLFWGVLAVLLIACLNVAGLFVARQASRRREIATRAALGAPRYRLVSQLLAESVVVTAVGGAAGVLLAYWLVGMLQQLQPIDLPHAEAIKVDTPVWLFAWVVSAAAAALAAIRPGLQTRDTAASELRLSASMHGRPGDRRFRGVLVVAELALSLVLLVVAGLLGRSFNRLLHVDLGVDTADVLTVDTILTMGRTLPRDEQIARMHDVVDRVRRLPFVTAAGAAIDLPPNAYRSTFVIDSRDAATGEFQVRHVLGLVNPTPGYFAALRIPLIKGRLFTDADSAGALPVTILSATAAKTLFGTDDPIGRPLPYGPAVASGAPIVVGVVGDVKYLSLDRLAGDMMYRPFAQNPFAASFVVARIAPGARVNAADLTHAIHDVDPGITVGPVRPLDEIVSEALAPPRFRTAIVGAFAVLALLLAAIGVYGVIAYSVAQRTREFGVRIALGATAADVFRLVLGEGAALAATGAITGLAGAFAVSKLTTRLLYGVTSGDPVSFGAAVICLVAVALTASYLPARRATRVDPLAALRAE